MSQNANQPKRFSIVGHEWVGDILEEMPDGDYVFHSDYAALAAENERLRKAGDAMMNTILNNLSGLAAIEQWHAAKEGRDAK